MCLAIPCKVLKVKENSWVEIEVAGTRHKVSLQLFPEVEVGDWVLRQIDGTRFITNCQVGDSVSFH